MEIIKVENLSFAYQEKPVLSDISFEIKEGEFITIFGKSGCGKTTLLKLLKPVISPYGKKEGAIYFAGNIIEKLTLEEQCRKIGFVMQNPDSQIVTDTVWHELAFGLENLSYSRDEIRQKISEISAYFGLDNILYQSTVTLSGGQKQLLNLASVMLLEPSVIILDEPTSQLDPIASSDFLQMIKKINREFGTTVIISEHRTEELFAISDKVMFLENGRMIKYDKPKSFTNCSNKNVNKFLPTPMRVYLSAPHDECPATINEGREWLKKTKVLKEIVRCKEYQCGGECVVSVKDVYFRYNKNLNDIVKGLTFTVNKGEFYAMLGGNGAGKTTALSLINSQNKPYRGKIKTNGKISTLPQNPQTLFTEKTVLKELEVMNVSSDIINSIISLCELGDLLDKHPYDLSGGEQQRTALAKVLLTAPDILLLDEPSKSLDVYFKEKLAEILKKLKTDGMTVIMVSHDIEFCARYTDRCAMFFDGGIIGENTPKNFFANKNFYTTFASRMAKNIIPNVVLDEDIIYAIGGDNTETETKNRTKINYVVNAAKSEEKKEIKEKISKKSLLSVILTLLSIPFTIVAGMYLLNDRKYLFISLIVIIEAMIGFVTMFEGRKPKTGDIVIIAVLSALCVVGRGAFYMLPQFKPMLALVIITGVSLGAQSGFLVGAVGTFISNFMLGQGPWTPWQMLATGAVGFLAGLIFKRGRMPKTKTFLCIYGCLSAVLIYGGILNPASVLMFQTNPTKEMFMLSIVKGLPMDIIHGISTVFFLWIIAKPMIEKLERIKTKYGLNK